VGLRALAVEIILLASLSSAALAAPFHLRCEYLQNPVGIDRAAPQLSWQMDSSERNWEQAAYEIFVASTAQQLQAGKADVWDSGKINSSVSVGIPYAGPKLESQRHYFWKVRVWDTYGRASDSTESAWWEMGLLSPTDWKAQWITWTNPDAAADTTGIHWIWVAGQNSMQVIPPTSATFRKKITLSAKPFDAALIVAARGDYVAAVNGYEVGRKSDWRSFDRRDITEQLVPGENTIEIRGSVPLPDPPSDAKPVPAALAALIKITAEDGAVTRYATSPDWEGKLDPSGTWSPSQVIGALGDSHFPDTGPMPESASYLRKTLELPEKVKNARLFVTALGSYRFFINGRTVSDDVLTPGFTDYRKRVQYQTYDVTPMLVRGKNALGVLLGEGWYGSGITWAGAHFFPPPERLLAQLEIEYTNGRHETVVTNDSWKGTASPILQSEIYAGEIYDARRDMKDWNEPSFDDSRWAKANIVETPAPQLSSQIDLPPQVVMQLTPKSVSHAADGSYVFDMGQNMVGWVALKVKGPKGTRVRLRFAEILKPDGTIYTENLRNADATDLYVLKGVEEEKFSPHFTFHGFRYVELTGYPGIPDTSSLTGEVVSSLRGKPTAKIITSSELVNRMWLIGIWGQRGNFLSIPTDCPQRDERLGWMGDAGVFWRTGSYNFDIAAFSQKFVQDIVDAQIPQGAFTNVSPNTLPADDPEGTQGWLNQMTGAPGWGDAGVIVPWTMWMQYGNTDVITRNWDAMQRWMAFIESHNPDFLRKNALGPNYADWLAPDERTDKAMLATAYWALITRMMAEMARATAKDQDAKRYEDLLAKIRAAFQKSYITEDGTVATGTQTSYVVALYTKMAPKELEPKLAEHLVKDIEANNEHLSTGFLGTPFLLFTLADHGRTDVAYRLLLNETYPSWGYMLSKGATTWWERWNGDTGDPGMNSYNHYAFGSVVAWIYRYAAGIDTTTSAPGFKKIVVHPHPDSRLNHAKGEYDSVYGKISSEWINPADGPFKLELTIPANTSADVYLPKKQGATVFEGGKKIDAEARDDSFLVHIGSGTYQFEVN
jgi:alpha-L-rhamnosidase